MVFLINFIQSLQRLIYKGTSHTYKVRNINGKVFALQSVFLQKTDEIIDLQNPIFKRYQIRFIEKSPCGQYNEFFTIHKIENIE